jgi:YwiC-like protein
MSETTIRPERHVQASVSASPAAGAINLRSVAIPVEHGGWGLLGEPLVLGLVIAPSWAGAGVGLACLGAFLAHHPARLVLADWRRQSSQRRTTLALGFVILYASVTAVGLVCAGSGSQGWWLPLALAAPLAVVQLACDARLQGRQLLPQLLGGIALGSVVAAEMRAAGLPFGPCLAAWALLAAKAVGAVLYVRARLRYDRGLAAARPTVVAFHIGMILAAVVLAGAGDAPWLAVAAFVLLLARAIHGLSPLHRPLRPQAVGVQEMIYGFSFALLLAIGYRLHL